MDLSSARKIKELLKRYDIGPSKGLGQNFLVDKGAVKKIIEAAELSLNDSVLEIGPGLGTLTQELSKSAKNVLAVEKDQRMVVILEETLKGLKNVEIIQGDILRIENLKLTENYKIVANLPFYLTAPVIRRFLEMTEARPLSMTLVVQKEVGQRICSKPPDMNLLAVSVQFYAQPKIISYISKNSFWPQPKVDSAIIKITPQPLPAGDRDLFFKIVKAGFSHPRKQLINNLSEGLQMSRQAVEVWLIKNEIHPTQRAETLSIKNWQKLAESFKMKQ